MRKKLWLSEKFRLIYCIGEATIAQNQKLVSAEVIELRVVERQQFPIAFFEILIDDLHSRKMIHVRNFPEKTLSLTVAGFEVYRGLVRFLGDFIDADGLFEIDHALYNIGDEGFIFEEADLRRRCDLESSVNHAIIAWKSKREKFFAATKKELPDRDYKHLSIDILINDLCRRIWTVLVASGSVRRVGTTLGPDQREYFRLDITWLFLEID